MLSTNTKIICVTNRKLCRGDYWERLDNLSKNVDYIILREKDLQEEEYFDLAKKAYDICGEKLIIHSYPKVAMQLGIRKLHLPLPGLLVLTGREIEAFDMLGTSCHSVEDCLQGKAAGCTYLVAGHIFETDCKKGLPGRGIGFLKQIVEQSRLPVYGIGGINGENFPDVIAAGAAGACIMSGLMQCEDVEKYIKDGNYSEPCKSVIS